MKHEAVSVHYHETTEENEVTKNQIPYHKIITSTL